MRKLLIISPRFPPRNLPDLHRVRTSLPYYEKYGWDPTVLCVDSESSEGVDDPLLASSLSKNIKIHAAVAWSERKCRIIGFGQLGYRSVFPLYRLGSKLLSREKYDVIFFSTTVFLSFILGPIWKWRFGCKLVYDMQDPWYAGDEPIYTRETAPGRWWKYRLDQWFAKYLERFVLKRADHIISVSEGYVTTLKERYSLKSSKFTIIPFGAAKFDYEFVRDRGVKHKIDWSDKRIAKWVSIGRAGHDMSPILRSLFSVLTRMKYGDHEELWRVRLYFVGTNYASSERTEKMVEPLARECRAEYLVEEHSERIPYFQSLSLYRNCDAIILVGSVHGDYTASKFMNCVLSKKPILALFHRDSLVSRIAPRFSNVFLATFDSDPSEPEFTARIRTGIEWLRAPNYDVDTIDFEIKPWLAEELTKTQCEIFDRVATTASGNL